jgi:hypothetical protein
MKDRVSLRVSPKKLEQIEQAALGRCISKSSFLRDSVGAIAVVSTADLSLEEKRVVLSRLVGPLIGGGA